jgi:hypothetical protein
VPLAATLSLSEAAPLSPSEATLSSSGALPLSPSEVTFSFLTGMPAISPPSPLEGVLLSFSSFPEKS